MNLYTEISTNVNAYPVMNFTKNKKVFPFVHIENSSNIITTNNLWNHENYMIMDIITTKYAEQFFKTTYNPDFKNSTLIPNSNLNSRITNNLDSLLTKDKLQNIKNRSRNCLFLKQFELMSDFPFLKKYYPKKIMELFENTSKCKFMFSKYKVKIFDKQSKMFINASYNMKNLDNFFGLNIDCKINNRCFGDTEYTIRFDNILSILYTFNIQSLNFVALNPIIFEANKYSQLLFRKCILEESLFHKKSFIFPVEHFKQKLNIITDNYILLDRCLSEITELGLVKNAKRVKHNVEVEFSKKYQKVSS